MTILENIFSVKNSDNVHKIITILGLKFKFYNKNAELKLIKKELDNLKELILEIKKTTKDTRKKVISINRDQVLAFQYETGIELNNNFIKERQIVFSPNDVPKDHYKRYSFAVENIENDEIVADVACTCGYGSSMLSAKAKEVIGVDISQPVINFANKVYASDKISFLCQDAQNLVLPKKIDTVVSFETIEHIPNPELFLKRVYSSLNSNGKLICSVPNEITRPWAEDKNEFHYRHYTKVQFEQLLDECGFVIKEIYQQYKDSEFSIEKRVDEGDMLIVIATKKG